MELPKKALLFLSLFLPQFFLFANSPQIIISELHRDPKGSESAFGGGLSHEFIELTNITKDTVSLDSLLFTDGVEVDTVIAWKNNIPLHANCTFGSNFLLPSQSALILDADYAAAINENPQCALPIDSGTVILTTKDNDLGNGLQSDDGIILFKGTKKGIKRVLFSASDEPWTSTILPDEKVRLSYPKNIEGLSVVPVSFLFENVVYNCKQITPGRLELFMNSWFFECKCNFIDTIRKNASCSVKTVYNGNMHKSSIEWLISSADNQSIQRGQSNSSNGIFTANLNLPINKGDLYFTIESQSKWLIDCVNSGYDDYKIRISEIYPKANTGETEWFEIINYSKTNSANLQNCKFGNSEDTAILTDEKLVASPGECIVFCKDSLLLRKKFFVSSRICVPPHWHILNNSKDTLILFTPDNHVLDLISYDSKDIPDWDHESLERLENNNNKWRVVSNPSPGTLIKPEKLTSNNVEIGPIPFTPNSDKHDDLLMISIPDTLGSPVTITIYSFDGKKIRTLKGKSQKNFLWDGKKENGSYAPVGPFFIITELQTSSGTKKYRNKGILWR